MIVEGRIREPLEMGDLWWKRTVKEAFKNDPIRIIIELIKNSADSYERLRQKEQAPKPFKILVKIFCSRGRPPYVEVIDNAEGMNSKKLRLALKYGPSTELKEYEKKYGATSAEKRIGLKDGLMAMAPNNTLVTIKDGLISECKIEFENGRPFVDYARENKEVTEKERSKLNILSGNGTVVKGRLPPYFPRRTFKTICEDLRLHFMMRKLLQIPEYEIYVINVNSGERVRLTYSQPKVDKSLLKKEEIEIPYDGKKYKIYLVINKARKNLTQGKPFGGSGLIFYYSKYSVLDCSFGSLEGDPATSKLFGEVKMNIGELIKGGEILVDEKRRGLDLTHDFNKALLDEINKRLRKIVEEEKEASEYSLDETTERDVLKELNKISREVKGPGPPPPPPVEPETLTFYPEHICIKEYEEKSIFLVINPAIITSDGGRISIRSANPKIRIVRGQQIKIKREEIEADKFIVKRIPLLGEGAGVKGDIFAETTQYSVRAGVEVLENPMFYPKNGFAFVPEKTTIIDSGKKKVNLIIKPEIIEKDMKRISLNSDNYIIICPGEWILPDDVQKLDKYRIKDIIRLEIPIEVKAKKQGNIGEKANIIAKYGDKDASLLVEVTPEVGLGGLFRGIEPSPDITQKISEFDRSTGILKLYYNHPLLKKYMKKRGFQKRYDFMVFVTDTLTREAIKAIVESTVEGGSSKFVIFDLDNPRPEIEKYITEQYYKEGARIHDILPRLCKTLKLERAI